MRGQQEIKVTRHHSLDATRRRGGLAELSRDTGRAGSSARRLAPGPSPLPLPLQKVTCGTMGAGARQRSSSLTTCRV